MKTRLLYLLLVLFVNYNLHAEEILVTPSTFTTEYALSSDGDVLLMTTGDYTSNFDFPSGKTITLKAADGEFPVFKGEVRGNTETNNGGLIFDGVEINRNNSYVVSAALGDISLMAFRNLTIQNVNRCLINTSTAGYTIEKIEFDNCIIKDCGSGGWNFIYPKHSVQAVLVKNSTLYNYTNGESFFFPNQAYTNNVLSFIFENNTVYKWAKSSDRALAKVEAKYNAASTYVFRNNIITEPGISGTTPQIVQVASGGVTAENNLIVNYGGYTGGTQAISDLTLSGLGLTVVGFSNPDNGDFLLTNSPLATAGIGNAPIGDPRWIKTVTNAVTLVASVSSPLAGNVTPSSQEYAQGSTATVTATANYGYRFKEWQKNEVKVSEDNPYSFTITEDTELSAIFETVTTYSLTVGKTGNGASWGAIKLSPEPVNGIYEEDEVVTVTIIPNSVTNFTQWLDGNVELSRQITMDGNKTLTATFDLNQFIVAWDFNSPATIRNNRPGDLYFKEENKGILRFFNGDNSSTAWGGSTKTFGGITYDCARRYTDYDKMDDPRYFQAEFSTKGYKNIQLHSYVGVDNVCVHKKQKLQYATTASGPYNDLATVDLTDSYNNEWVELGGILPESLNDQETVYVRWVADASSDLFGVPTSGTEGFYVADIVAYADIDTGTPTRLDSDQSNSEDEIKVYYDSNSKKIFVEANEDIDQISVYGLTGVLLLNKKCDGTSAIVNTELFSGLNLIKITLKNKTTIVSKIIVQ